MRALVAPLAAVSLGAALLVIGSPAHAGADGCDPSTLTDFDGDGRDDAVAGDPTADDGRGQITVHYGTSSGHVGDGVQLVYDANDFEGAEFAPQLDAGFGTSLATGDADCDGYTDVLVGAPYHDISDGGTQADAGYAVLIFGASGGLGEGADAVTYTSLDFMRPHAAGDRFGFSVDLVEDVGQGGTPAPDAYALAIGVPGRDSDGMTDSGAVATRTPLDGGSQAWWIDEGTPGIPGGVESGDAFGTSVALMYGNAEYVDLVVGSPLEDVGSKKDAGTITFVDDLYGDEFAGAATFSQNSTGVSSDAEKGDRFGHALAASHSGNTVFLAVGAPLENVGSKVDAGIVHIFGTSGTGPLTARGALTQDTSGVKDKAERGDKFGAALAAGLAGSTYVAIGVPGEDGPAANTGLVQVVKAANVASDTVYTQSSAGVAGGAAAGDEFGRAVSLLEGQSEDVLLVGTPFDNAFDTGVVHVIPYRGGSAIHQTWLPEDGTKAAGFGRSIGGQAY